MPVLRKKLLILILGVLIIASIPIFFGTKHIQSTPITISIENPRIFPPKYSLEDRNNQRWKQLENQYRFINLSLLTNPILQPGKTITYECVFICGGLGDRIRGIIMCYFLSILSNRQLIVNMERPCSFSNYIQPNKYQWIRGSNYRYNGSVHRIRVIDDNPNWVYELKSTPFLDRWSKVDHVHIEINVDFIGEIFANKNLQSHPIIAMFLKEMSESEANYQTLFSLFYEILFRPTERIVRVVDNLLINRSPEHLICTHLRIGENPSNPRDHPFEYRHQIAQTIQDFLSTNKFLERNPLWSLFVSSDSAEVTTQILERFSNRSFSIPGPILQIDLPVKVDCNEGYIKVVADFYLLSECSIVVLTNSGFSAYANRRRFNPYANLYKYNQKQNRVQKCLDLRSPKKWEPGHSNRIKLFCPVQTDNYTLEDIL